MSETTKAILVSDIPEGQSKCVEIGRQRVAIFNVDGKFYAIDDGCTHSGGPLSDGELDGLQVTCPWHGASFDIATGKVCGPPATSDVKSHKVTVEGNELRIELS